MNDRQARRIRVIRRQRAAAGLPTTVLTLTAHGQQIAMWDHPGKIAGCWRLGRPYERPLLEWVHQRRLRGVALDVGANIGNHSLWLSGICGLRVVAFEPVEYVALRHSVALNPHLPIRVEPVALGSASTTAEHTGAGRLATGSGDLPVRRLDDYRLANITLIKIDVEGMEPHVLRGGERTIRRDRPVILAEEHNQTEHDAIAAVLTPWRYRMTDRLHSRGQATPMGIWEAR